jgi:uncharacterized protein YlaN (UPF0358 family)
MSKGVTTWLLYLNEASFRPTTSLQTVVASLVAEGTTGYAATDVQNDNKQVCQCEGYIHILDVQLQSLSDDLNPVPMLHFRHSAAGATDLCNSKRKGHDQKQRLGSDVWVIGDRRPCISFWRGQSVRAILASIR